MVFRKLLRFELDVFSHFHSDLSTKLLLDYWIRNQYLVFFCLKVNYGFYVNFQASPIQLAGRQVYIEERRANISSSSSFRGGSMYPYTCYISHFFLNGVLIFLNQRTINPTIFQERTIPDKLWLASGNYPLQCSFCNLQESFW